MILRVHHNNDFTMLTNAMLRDVALSFKARGLLACMLSRPNDWCFYRTELASLSEQDGETAINSAIHELTVRGYLTRTRVKDAAGKWQPTVWEVRETPTNDDQPQGENPPVGNRHLQRTKEQQMHKSPRDDKTLPATYHPQLLPFVKRFFEVQRTNWPTLIRKVTPAQISQSVDTLDKLIRLDGYPLGTVVKACAWATTDTFWSRNVLSLAGLRQRSKNGQAKFTNLLAQMEREADTGPTMFQHGTGTPAARTINRADRAGTVVELMPRVSAEAEELLAFLKHTAQLSGDVPVMAVVGAAESVRFYYTQLEKMHHHHATTGPTDHLPWKLFWANWLNFLHEKQSTFPLRGVQDLAVTGTRWREYVQRCERYAATNFTNGARIE